MKWKKLLYLIPFITLVGCKGNNEITTKCPLGAPSLLFYDQGNNSNFVTISGAAQIVAEFQQNKYDALVVDATTGLRQIKKYPNTPYRLAKLLTAGNLYLVSLNFTSDPISSSSILSFGNETSVPYYLTNELNKTWKSNKLDYKSDVANVLANALNNTHDYYVLAEPALTTLKSKKTVLLSKKLELGDVTIPQAALFINKNSYYNKKDKMTKYISDLKSRINICINNPQEFKEQLDKYGDESTVSQRFGFTSSVAYKVQKDDPNGFAIFPNEKKFTYVEMNNFLNSVSQQSETYTKEEFIDVE